MKRILCGLTILAFFVGCSDGQRQVASKMAVIDGVDVNWRVFNPKYVSKIAGYDPKRVPFIFGFSDPKIKSPEDCPLPNSAPNSGLEWKECWNNAIANVRKKQRKYSKSETVRLAKLAVQRSNECRWEGFNPVFDQFARSTGALASQSDNRILFVQLKCS